jgi:hypothetical protein
MGLTGIQLYAQLHLPVQVRRVQIWNHRSTIPAGGDLCLALRESSALSAWTSDRFAGAKWASRTRTAVGGNVDSDWFELADHPDLGTKHFRESVVAWLEEREIGDRLSS